MHEFNWGHARCPIVPSSQAKSRRATRGRIDVLTVDENGRAPQESQLICLVLSADQFLLDLDLDPQIPGNVPNPSSGLRCVCATLCVQDPNFDWHSWLLDHRYEIAHALS
jgi:hypothetical protein